MYNICQLKRQSGNNKITTSLVNAKKNRLKINLSNELKQQKDVD